MIQRVGKTAAMNAMLKSMFATGQVTSILMIDYHGGHIRSTLIDDPKFIGGPEIEGEVHVEKKKIAPP